MNTNPEVNRMAKRLVDFALDECDEANIGIMIGALIRAAAASAAATVKDNGKQTVYKLLLQMLERDLANALDLGEEDRTKIE